MCTFHVQATGALSMAQEWIPPRKTPTIRLKLLHPINLLYVCDGGKAHAVGPLNLRSHFSCGFSIKLPHVVIKFGN